MKHIVNVSGGNASAVALFRVIELFGRDDVIARFADVRTEDPDLYRFLDDLQNAAGVPIERVSDGRNIWDVFATELMWTAPKNGGCVASWRLKRLALQAHIDRLWLAPTECVIYVGFDASEDDRMDRLRIAGAPWRYEFPLAWSPKLLRCEQDDYVRSRGLTPCSMYDRGYSHANCGGTCVVAGIGQWSMVLRDYPDRYAFAEEQERRNMQAMRDKGREPQSILRDRRGGVTRNLTLAELREAIERGERPDGDDARLGSCSCIGGLVADYRLS